MKKSEFRLLPFGSAEYVVAHANRRAARGKRPSATFKEPECAFLLLNERWVRNPRMALHLAQRYCKLHKAINGKTSG